MAQRSKISFSERTFSPAEQADIAGDDAEFEDCTFGKLQLNGRHFTRCRFFDCTFENCDLTLARVVDCSFVRTSFKHCRLTGINWSEVTKLERVSFANSQLNDATFIGTNADACDFSKCVAHRASFRDSSLKSAVFRDADLAETEFVNSDLRLSDFRGATGYVINPKENRLDKARFSLPEAVRLLPGLGILLD